MELFLEIVICRLTDGRSANQPAALTGGKDGGQVPPKDKARRIKSCRTDNYQIVKPRLSDKLHRGFGDSHLSWGGKGCEGDLL